LIPSKPLPDDLLRRKVKTISISHRMTGLAQLLAPPKAFPHQRGKIQLAS